VAQDPVVGTEWCREKFAASIVTEFTSPCPMGSERRTRTDTARDCELSYAVLKDVQRFASTMLADGRRQLTKTVTEEDVVRMNTAH